MWGRPWFRTDAYEVQSDLTRDDGEHLTPIDTFATFVRCRRKVFADGVEAGGRLRLPTAAYSEIRRIPMRSPARGTRCARIHDTGLTTHGGASRGIDRSREALPSKLQAPRSCLVPRSHGKESCRIAEQFCAGAPFPIPTTDP